MPQGYERPRRGGDELPPEKKPLGNTGPALCPGYETEPNICGCPCSGCRYNCGAHKVCTWPECLPEEEKAELAEKVDREMAGRSTEPGPNPRERCGCVPAPPLPGTGL